MILENRPEVIATDRQGLQALQNKHKGQTSNLSGAQDSFQATRV